MTKNVQRGTPGLLLLLWAALLPAAVLLAWRLDRHRDDFEWMEYPTALGDTRYYTQLGTNDLYEPNLKFDGEITGLFRRVQEPVAKADGTMFKIAKEKEGRCLIYVPEESLTSSKGGSVCGVWRAQVLARLSASQGRPCPIVPQPKLIMSRFLASSVL
jgi:hypothetical protein